MRLRLVIQRHGLPSVQLIWTVGDVLSAFTPEPAALISQLLEQVNEIIPLEAEDWGLEDYVVEVGGFECLHFSELSRILRDDDEVRIRPLQTSDLRFRKVSGRHQISADGRHLIDGVTFGRPLLKRTDRPPVIIPPRKRRRITYEEDSNEIFDETANNQQDAIHAGLADLHNIFIADDSGVDDEYSPDEEEIDELSMELKDLRNDMEEDHDVVAEGTEALLDHAGAATSPRRSTRSRKAGGLGLEGEGMLKLVDENGRPYPREYDNPLLDLYLYEDDETQRQRQSRPDLPMVISNKRKCKSDIRQNVERNTEESDMQSERVSRGTSDPAWKGVRFQDVHLETPATVRNFQDSDHSDREDFPASSDMIPDQDGSDKENSEPRYELAESRALRTRKYSSPLFTSSEIESEEKDYSFHSSIASTSSDSSVKQVASRVKPDVEAEAGAAETWSPELPSESDHPSYDDTKASDASKDSESVDILVTRSWKRSLPSFGGQKKGGKPVVSKPQSLPHTGKSVTKKRNQRRRDHTRLMRLKSRGVLSPNATIADYHRMQENKVTAKEPPAGQTENSQEKAIDAHTAFETKRETLLKAIASGGINASLHVRQENRSCQDIEDSATIEETVPGNERKTHVDERPMISDGSQRNRPTNQTQSLPDMKAASPNNSISLLGEIGSSADEVEVPSHSLKTAANMTTVADGVEAPSNGILTSPLGPAIETNKSSPQKSESHKRSRLDILSSKRLVYGFLGVRVPQTKEDEAKVTAKLMKDVRPLQTFRTEEANKVSGLPATRPNDSWKDKIVLMAVECCEDGVELSTPPFPFVQRWDPQQRKASKNGNNSRRGKKRKRNDDQNYTNELTVDENEDMFGGRSSASFGLENSAAGGSIGPPLEQQEQKASGTENDEHENFLAEKLQREPDDPVPALADRGGVQDLPSLPEDISTCLPLAEMMTLPGSVIAFKQLDMSEKTNWQPKISDYRTARVDCLTDDGTLRMRLAKRDQSNKEEHFDQHTGKRFYSKFEMPGFDDDCEDPGIVEISFSELIEPKLIQAAIIEPALQQSSFHDDVHSPPGMDTVMETNVQSSPAGLKPTDPELPEAVMIGRGMAGRGMAGANESVRQEIFDLIKEAGWRSSIRSGNEDGQRSERNSPTSQARPLSQDQLNSRHAINGEEENPGRFPSGQFNGFNSSPPRGSLWEPPNQRSPEGLRAESPQSNHVSEIAETVPGRRSTVPDTPTKTSFGGGDGAVDVRENCYDKGSAWSEPQYQTGADHQRSSPELSSPKPVSGSVVSRVQLKAQTLKIMPTSDSPKIVPSSNSPTSLHEVSSDNEFPTLENVFSQVRSSQAISRQSRVSDDDLTYMAKSSFESTTTKGRGSQEEMSLKLESNGEGNHTRRETLFKWEDSDEGDQPTPRASQRTVQPDIVDLTLPSDPADARGDSDYIDDGTQLPTGPGWVKKTRATSRHRGSMKQGERRLTRSSSRGIIY